MVGNADATNGYSRSPQPVLPRKPPPARTASIRDTATQLSRCEVPHIRYRRSDCYGFTEIAEPTADHSRYQAPTRAFSGPAVGAADGGKRKKVASSLGLGGGRVGSFNSVAVNDGCPTWVAAS